MLKSFPLLVAMAFASAEPLHAQEIKGTRDFVTPRPSSSNPSGTFHYGIPLIVVPRRGDEVQTSFDRHFDSGGVAASLGFVCDNDGHAPQTHGASALAGSEPGRLLGTTLRVGF